MKISRHSWHYRLHTMVFTCWNIEKYGPFAYFEGRRYEHSPKSLCGYFWSTMILSLLLIPMAVVVGILLLCWVVYLTFSFFRRSYRTVRPKKDKPEKPPKPHPTRDLFVGFAKAKKSKVCPMIDVVD